MNLCWAAWLVRRRRRPSGAAPRRNSADIFDSLSIANSVQPPVRYSCTALARPVQTIGWGCAASAGTTPPPLCGSAAGHKSAALQAANERQHLHAMLFHHNMHRKTFQQPAGRLRRPAGRSPAHLRTSHARARPPDAARRRLRGCSLLRKHCGRSAMEPACSSHLGSRPGDFRCRFCTDPGLLSQLNFAHRTPPHAAALSDGSF